MRADAVQGGYPYRPPLVCAPMYTLQRNTPGTNAVQRRVAGSLRRRAVVLEQPRDLHSALVLGEWIVRVKEPVLVVLVQLRHKLRWQLAANAARHVGVGGLNVERAGEQRLEARAGRGLADQRAAVGAEAVLHLAHAGALLDTAGAVREREVVHPKAYEVDRRHTRRAMAGAAVAEAVELGRALGRELDGAAAQAGLGVGETFHAAQVELAVQWAPHQLQLPDTFSILNS